jgi:D-amino peptidase
MGLKTRWANRSKNSVEMGRYMNPAYFSRRSFLACTKAAALAAPFAIRSSLAQKTGGLKIFVLWDMEGASGIFTREQAWYWEPGVREEVATQGRELFTADVNSLSAAVLEAGISDLIVCDTHHGGGNLIQDKLLTDRRVRYDYRSVGLEDGKRRWLPGLDETVAGLMLPGHHAKAFTQSSFMPHAWSREWADFRINGRSVGEIGIEACYAGHWNIPLIFVQGDEAACREAEEQFPGVVTAAVKHANTDELASGMHPEAAHRETARKAAEAIEKARSGALRPFKPTLPMTVTIRMRTMDAATKIATKPGVMKLDDHTVEARVGRQCDIVKWITGSGLDMAA